MAITLISPPQDSTVIVGQTHRFEVFATTTVEPITYQWLVNGVIQDGETTSVFNSLVATAENSFSQVEVLMVDGDGSVVSTLPALAIATTASASIARHALHWRYDDNTHAWADAAVEIESSPGSFRLVDIGWMFFGFVPGFQKRWSDFQSGGPDAATWNELKEGGATPTRWSDMYSEGQTKELIQIVDGQVFLAEKVDNRQNSLKRYYLSRTQLDFGDKANFDSERFKRVKEFIFHMQSDQSIVLASEDNQFDFYVGWSDNLMDSPDWEPAITVVLEDTANLGDYKIDVRTSGRYLSYSFDVTNTRQIAFTGGEIDVVQAGRR